MEVPESFYLGKPVRSLQTMLRMVGTNNGSISRVIPDGIYGKQTEAAVRSYQRYAGLPVTGVVNFATWQQLTYHYQQARIDQMQSAPLLIVMQPNQRILPGEKNSHLYLIQSMMVVLAGFFANMPMANITGIHDEPSQQAVSFLKSMSEMDANPVIDKTFYALLGRIYRTMAGDGVNVR